MEIEFFRLNDNYRLNLALVEDKIECTNQGQIDIKGSHKPIRIYWVEINEKENSEDRILNTTQKGTMN